MLAEPIQADAWIYSRAASRDPMGPWMQTYSGNAFYPLDPRPEDIFIEDIIAGLSKMCRYSGQCNKFYSVAEHSVIVSHYVRNENALAGLLHDASEAYINDVPRPVKDQMPIYNMIERRIMDAVYRKFGIELDPAAYADVKRVDNAILANEMQVLLKTPPQPWNLPEPPLPDLVITAMGPYEAAEVFLHRFIVLTATKN